MGNTELTHIPNAPSTTNEAVFSDWTNAAVNNIISLAEARARYSAMNKWSQSASAFVRHLLWTIGLEIWSNVADDAAELVRLRALTVAANEPIMEVTKSWTNW